MMISTSARTRLADIVITVGAFDWLGPAMFLCGMWWCVNAESHIDGGVMALVIGYLAGIRHDLAQVKRKLDGMS